MNIRIKGKFERGNRSIYTQKEIDEISWIGDQFVFIDYLDENIFLGDVFVLEDGTEITLQEIKLQFYTKEPLTEMGQGWKCLCRFENLDLKNVPAIKSWLLSSSTIIASKKDWHFRST